MRYTISKKAGTGLVSAMLLIATVSLPALAGQDANFLKRPAGTQVRLMSYNINWDAIFPTNDPASHRYRQYSRGDAFVRILKAIKPDIVCLQEINPQRNAQQVADILDSTLPLPKGEKWRAYLGRDNIIAARYDLSTTASDTAPSSNRGHATALIDLPAKIPADLYIINAHFKSAGGQKNIARRQLHADAIVNWIRDARTPGGAINLPHDTPIVILGDLNVYPTDPHHHLETLVTGDIVNEEKFGADFKPDWDQSDLTDALPKQNGNGPDTYTWRNDSSKFKPYELDHIIYTDSALKVLHSFVLNTRTMSGKGLKAAGLEKDDVVLNPATNDFDHLPLVVDLAVIQPE